MKRLFMAVLGVALLSGGCVRAQHFRYVQNQPECFAAGTDPFSNGSKEQRPWPSLDCLHTLYNVGFIEFREDGKLIDPLQERKALALIDEARRRAPDGKVITIVYVHGWKNNASEASPGGEEKDVEKFTNALTELGYRSYAVAKQRDGDRPNPLPVVGIYMAWRGKSLMGPDWFTFISYWPRRNTANRVGDGPDFAPTLKHIIDKVNEGDTGSRLALIGHSFGARVLEHAINRPPDGVELYTPAGADPATGAVRVKPLVDLTLFVNSANDARLSMAKVQALRAQPLHVRHPDYDARKCDHPTPDELQNWSAEDTERCRDYPLMVAITSSGDLATKYLLPVATTIAPDGKRPPTPPKPAGDFLDRVPNPAVYKRSAAGHMRFMQSHDVREISCPAVPDPVLAAPRRDGTARPLSAMIADAIAVAVAVGRADEVKALEEAEKKAKQAELDAEADDRARLAAIEARTYATLHPLCEKDDARCRFVLRTQDESPVCFQADERLPATSNGRTLVPFNQTAFWIMNVDPVVIRDHGDIWNLSFVEMLSQLMAARGFFDAHSGRVQLSAQ